MKILFFVIFIVSLFAMVPLVSDRVEAKSYIKSYYRSSGTRVRSYIRYKADGYRFNNYMYRPDRGYRR